MNLPVPLYVGLRYLRARHRHRFISFISLVSTLGIALGLTAVIAVMSVMNGFHTEIRDRLLGMVSHISVSEPDRRLEDWRGLAEQLEQNPEVVASAPFIEGQGMLLHRDRVSGVGLRGMLPALEAEASRIAEHIKKGSLDQLEAGAYRIVLGDELARHLNVRVGDQVTLIVPRAASTIAGLLPKFRRFEVVGIFDLDMRSYDRHLALVHLDDARQALALGEGEVGGLKVRLQDLFKAPWLADQLREELGGRYWVLDWSDLDSGFFKAIQMEKTMLFLLLMLIVLVAAFNIISTLLMTVLEKRSDIAVLRTLGMTRRGTLQVFLLQGLAIGIGGTVLGVGGGLALSHNLQVVVGVIEKAFSFKLFSPEVYYISEIPSQLLWGDVVIAAVASIILSIIAAVYPARKALQVMPAEVLRYE